MKSSRSRQSPTGVQAIVCVLILMDSWNVSFGFKGHQHGCTALDVQGQAKTLEEDLDMELVLE